MAILNLTKILTRKKKFFDERANDDTISELTDHCFKVNTFFIILDVFSNVLKTRFKDFSNVVKKFEILDPKKSFQRKKTDDLCFEPLQKLSEFYQVDVDQNDLIMEYKMFCSVYNQLNKKSETILISDILKFMILNDMVSSYPNLYILYKIYLTLPVSSATAERSFSRLKLIKNTFEQQ